MVVPSVSKKPRKRRTKAAPVGTKKWRESLKKGDYVKFCTGVDPLLGQTFLVEHTTQRLITLSNGRRFWRSTGYEYKRPEGSQSRILKLSSYEQAEWDERGKKEAQLKELYKLPFHRLSSESLGSVIHILKELLK